MNDDVPRPLTTSDRMCHKDLDSSLITVCLDVQDQQWLAHGDHAYYNGVCVKALQAVASNVPTYPIRAVEVSIVLTSNDVIQALNQQYRGQDKPTNILSFESGLMEVKASCPEDIPLHFGDLVLAFDVIQTEAQDQGKSFDQHLRHLIVHGLLHLLGYDHEDAVEADAMEHLEITILTTCFNDPNPYE